ncbi:MAG: putative quinol monooxygenase [Steroidobacteraceae bacterium]
MAREEAVQVVCIAEFLALEGKTDALIDALHSLLGPTHAEPGCIRYELNRRVDMPRMITFIEKWCDRQSFDAHCAMPYIAHYFNDVRPFLVASFEVKMYRELLPEP